MYVAASLASFHVAANGRRKTHSGWDRGGGTAAASCYLVLTLSTTSRPFYLISVYQVRIWTLTLGRVLIAAWCGLGWGSRCSAS